MNEDGLSSWLHSYADTHGIPVEFLYMSRIIYLDPYEEILTNALSSDLRELRHEVIKEEHEVIVVDFKTKRIVSKTVS